MGDFAMRAKHWQVFLLTLPVLVLMNLNIVGAELIGSLISAVAYCLYFIWFAFLGTALFPLLPRGAYYNLSWFIVDIILSALAFSALVILTDDRSFHGEGPMALVMLYAFFALLHGPWFLAVSLVSIEKQHDPEFGFYFGTLLCFLFWPVGVWFIQPRLNKVWKESRSREQQLGRAGIDG
ncbi:hypothetical protein [Hymenobacter persicinus]|uniref:Uncharacterized protein n=1 Tax=Hymenobacter persicinus TaxID=2025506 RepID=A0A4V1ZB86_9BACT|nr:hypothetical protein [Hymenobacter persicinus]RYU83847.1 hypothetical protein EWM57_02590 [Hymenobacter persicinus]